MMPALISGMLEAGGGQGGRTPGSGSAALLFAPLDFQTL